MYMVWIIPLRGRRHWATEYMPQMRRETFSKQIAKVISSEAKGMVQMGGDFNTTPKWQIGQVSSRPGTKHKKIYSIEYVAVQ